jgi:hypothetical protein
MGSNSLMCDLSPEPTVEALLDLLFGQITWPSGLVRERACVGVSNLLVKPEESKATEDYLLGWIKGCALESVACYPLLAVARARDLAPTSGPSRSDLSAALPCPSLLSWMILNEIDGTAQKPIEASSRHSGSAPSSFTPNPFFEKYVRSFLPPVYYDSFESLIKPLGDVLIQQWAYEWDGLVDRTGTSLTARPMDFWLGRTLPGDERYVSVDTTMSEVYRSAYLRAVSWALSSDLIDEDLALRFAVSAAPVDLELWKVRPGQRPGWWPVVGEITSEIDTAPGEIWAGVSQLWERQLRCEPWSSNDQLGGDRLLAHASGMVHSGDSTYDLAIRGVFQKTSGPRRPELTEMAEWLRNTRPDASVAYRSLLRFNGVIRGADPDEYSNEFGDWSLLPAFVSAMPLAVPRWQFWRMWRELWLPAPYMVRANTTFCAEDDAIVASDPTEGAVAEWRDWTDGLTEKLADGLPPPGGSLLTLRREVVEKFEEATQSSFSWLCTVVVYSRDGYHKPFEAFFDERFFGGSLIVKD